MKIAIVRARYSPFGGAERFVARAMEALAADRSEAIDVSILARSWPSIDSGNIAGSALAAARLIRCDPFHFGSVWRDASFASCVRRRLDVERFDLVQSHERIAGVSIYRAGDGVHESWLERRARAGSRAQRISTRAAIAANPHHRYLLRAERAMFEDPALRAVICNSTLVRREIAERFAIDPGKLVLIRNGVDLDRFHPDRRASRRRELRELHDSLGLADDSTMFLMVGSGFERKGVAQALRALAGCPGASLVIVGDDKHRDRYAASATRLAVADRVRFVGPVADPLPYYASADFLLAPTLYDPFPNAALEALACGLPVITSDASGAAELITEGVDGWVVPVDNAEALQVALQIAAGCDAARREAMSRAARVGAEPFSLAALSMALIALYRSLLAPAPGPRHASRGVPL